MPVVYGRVLFYSGVITVTPSAPTALTINDTLDTATWTKSSSHPNQQQEYTTNYTGARTVQDVSGNGNTVNVGDVNIATGDFAVRTKASSGFNPSAWLISTQAFTTTSTPGNLNGKLSLKL